ncbi:MAG: hypothetical protein NTX65_02545 [Ignavibacteriales bacterium]|nr:hypothetical protein [Ignavibacteriales bacterium]
MRSDKFFYLLSLICFLLIVQIRANAQILTFQETDRQGKVFDIDFRKSAFPIVDINSTLKISIDKIALRDQMGKSVKLDVESELGKLKFIIGILKIQNKILDLMGDTSSDYKTRRENIDLFSTSMGELESYISQDKKLRQMANEILGNDEDPKKQYEQIFDIVRQHINDLTDEIDKSLKEKRVYFRLGGFLRDQNGKTTPIHLPQFDTYSDGVFTEIPRFAMPAPEKLQQEFQNASKEAEDYNKKGITSFDRVKTLLSDLKDKLESGYNCFSDSLKKIYDVNTKDNRLITLMKPMLNSANAFATDVKNLTKLTREISNSSDPVGSGLMYFTGAIGILKTIQTHGKLLSDQFNSLEQQKGKIQAVLKETVDKVIKDSKICLANFGTFLQDSIGINISELQNWNAASVAKQTQVNLEFTDKVKFMLMEDIPDATEIDLRNTGQRSAGDEIHFKATVENKSDENQTPITIELERRSCTMYQIGLHSQLSAGVVFLDAINNSATKLTKQFQAAPSYSLLFKWGTRRSYIYNKFWNVGVGINIAAPDFNLDSTPEIALGIMATTALDYLQLGFGRNLGVDAWYWFFGLRLPVGSITLTGDEDLSSNK